MDRRQGIGVFISTDLTALEIWREALQTEKSGELADMRDVLIVEIGQDWAARRDAKAEHWLATHVGSPRVPPYSRLRKHR